MEDLKVYDRDGNPLSITEIVKSYIESKADQSNKSIEDIYIGMYERKGTAWIEVYEALDNGYDATDLIDLNISDEVK